MWDVIRRNPVRSRSVLVAVLVAAGWAMPDVLDPDTQHAIVGAVMPLLALIFGWDASKRVVLKPAAESAGEAAEEPATESEGEPVEEAEKVEQPTEPVEDVEAAKYSDSMLRGRAEGSATAVGV